MISTILLVHLSLEGPDHQEEIGPKHHADEANDSENNVKEDEGLQEIEEVEVEAPCSQAEPGPHEADVPLKYKHKEKQGGRSFGDSAVMKLELSTYETKCRSTTFEYLDQFKACKIYTEQRLNLCFRKAMGILFEMSSMHQKQSKIDSLAFPRTSFL